MVLTLIFSGYYVTYMSKGMGDSLAPAEHIKLMIQSPNNQFKDERSFKIPRDENK